MNVLIYFNMSAFGRRVAPKAKTLSVLTIFRFFYVSIEASEDPEGKDGSVCVASSKLYK